MRVNYLLAIILAVVLFGLGGIISPPAEAATFTVNSTLDAVDANPGDGLCAAPVTGNCTLRAAVMETNALSGSHTLYLPAGTYILTLTGSNEDNAASGDLDIKSNLIIRGAGAASTSIDGDGANPQNPDPDRVIQIIGPVQARLDGVTVTNGYIGSGSGGGIYNNGGELHLTNCAVTFNNAGVGAGAGINNDVNGALVVTGTLFQGNSTTGGNGGAVFNAGLFQSEANTFSANIGQNGGGIFNATTGILTINQDTITLNLTNGGGGGGVFNDGDLSVENSSFYYNETTAGTHGGALYHNETGSSLTLARLTNVTIAENTAAGNGGGIYNLNGNEGGLLLVNVTLYQNLAVLGGGAL